MLLLPAVHRRARATRILWAIACGVAAIAGHVRPVFLKFGRGGKGVATAAGVFFALAPIPMADHLRACSSSSCSRRLRLARLARRRRSCCPSLLLVTAGSASPLFLVSVVLAAFVFWTHRANIGRLRRGEEHRFGQARQRVRERARDAMRRASAPARGAPRSPTCSRATGTTSRSGRASPTSSRRSTTRHENDRFLAGAALAPALARDDRPRATRSTAPSSCCLAPPSHVLRAIAPPRAPQRSRCGATVCVATKGIERDTLALMTDVVAEEAPGHAGRRALRPELRRRGRRPGSRRRSSPRRADAAAQRAGAGGAQQRRTSASTRTTT